MSQVTEEKRGITRAVARLVPFHNYYTIQFRQSRPVSHFSVYFRDTEEELRAPAYLGYSWGKEARPRPSTDVASGQSKSSMVSMVAAIVTEKLPEARDVLVVPEGRYQSLLVTELVVGASRTMPEADPLSRLTYHCTQAYRLGADGTLQPEVGDDQSLPEVRISPGRTVDPLLEPIAGPEIPAHPHLFVDFTLAEPLRGSLLLCGAHPNAPKGTRGAPSALYGPEMERFAGAVRGLVAEAPWSLAPEGTRARQLAVLNSLATRYECALVEGSALVGSAGTLAIPARSAPRLVFQLTFMGQPNPRSAAPSAPPSRQPALPLGGCPADGDDMGEPPTDEFGEPIPDLVPPPSADLPDPQGAQSHEEADFDPAMGHQAADGCPQAAFGPVGIEIPLLEALRPDGYLSPVLSAPATFPGMTVQAQVTLTPQAQHIRVSIAHQGRPCLTVTGRIGAEGELFATPDRTAATLARFMADVLFEQRGHTLGPLVDGLRSTDVFLDAFLRFAPVYQRLDADPC
ncbi:hypothetical protein PAPYR_2677 [Paratrimastix pyriformis]|uniref:Uncharacterized protein n=1 Tax=Paratrimastix pyriformis TaxID=342808 RepID=A0ABQ8UNU7_9EUKA|nr:hypothetical protein PAPYR_2677 [Paratrimastix pyriformis]